MQLSGNPLDFLIAFAGGIVVSFTPCVYPLIPISISYIGFETAGSKIKGFVLSLIYVTGIAITYSTLGLLASLTGTIFGEISANPITYLFVGIFVIIFGLSMFGLFNLPSLGVSKIHVFKKHDYLSTLILGIISGLIISPCLTPVLGSILLYLTTKKSVLYGFTLLLSFAYGMGLVLILAGTFSAVLVNLPKSGRWLAYIKRFCASILIIVGIYYIFTAIRRF